MSVRVTRDNLVPLTALGPYFVFGLLALVGTAVMLLLALQPMELGAFRHNLVLAIVHGSLLGWATSIALGALQQMAPVVFGTELHNPAWARWVSVPYIVGVTALVVGLATFKSLLLTVGAVLVPLAVLLVMVNVWRSQRDAEVRAAKLIRPFVMSALIYLTLTVVAGASLAINVHTGWLRGAWLQVFPSHLALGLIGWLTMLVLGISYHLLPFFGLTEKKAVPRHPATVRLLLHAAVAVNVIASAAPVTVWLAPVSPVMLGLAAWLFLWDTRSLFASRPRNKIHPMVTHVRFAHVYLGVLAIGFLFAALEPLSPVEVTVLGVLGMGGWLANTVLGYLHRILPFYVWHNKYWGRGTEPGVPSFREMVSEGPAWLGLVLFNAGIAGIAVGLIWDIALAGYAILVLAGTLISVGNLIRTLTR